MSSCRQLLDRAAGVCNCCQCRSTSTSVSNSFRDRLRFYRVRRSACQTACIRAFLIVLNFVFLLCGCSLVVLGLYLHADRQSSIYLDLLQSIPVSGPLVITGHLAKVLVVMGMTVATLSFLGCCGACVDSACFLCLYILMLVIALAAQLIVGIAAVIYNDQISTRLQTALQRQIHNEYNRTATAVNVTGGHVDDVIDHVTLTWDAMQMKLNCCGAVSPHDYRYSAWFNHSRPASLVFVPASCCLDAQSPGGATTDTSLPPGGQGPVSASLKRVMADTQCQLEAILYPVHPSYSSANRKSYTLKTQGCQESISHWLHNNAVGIATIACFIFIIQLLDVVFACGLMSTLWQRHFQGSSQWSDESDVD